MIKRSGPVSRVLSSTEPRRRAPTLLKGDHSSGTTVAGGLLQPTRELRAGRPQTLLYLALHRMGFAKLPMSPPALVSSYLTLSPLPAFVVLSHTFAVINHEWPATSKLNERRQAVCSLWHFPWGHPRSALPTILPCGARTFLPPSPRLRRAVTRAAPQSNFNSVWEEGKGYVKN